MGGLHSSRYSTSCNAMEGQAMILELLTSFTFLMIVSQGVRALCNGLANLDAKARYRHGVSTSGPH